MKYDNLIDLCKRKGFFYPTADIYGGLAGFYDYGSIGVEILNNIKKEWWKSLVHDNVNIEGIDGSIVTNSKVWEASGHVSEFTDYFVKCGKGHEFRADHVIEDVTKKKTEGMDIKKLQTEINKIVCPKCKSNFGKVTKVNLMFSTNSGPEGKEIVYLRPETAQLIYINFKNVLNTTRQKIPFGIAQIGKAFRNEISPRNALFRMREFQQLEMQYFIDPKTAVKTLDRWKKERMKWYVDLGVKKTNLRFREHKKNELAHYAKKAIDIEYKFEFGWKELEGIHDRSTWDLSQHEKFSKKDLKYFDEEKKKKYIPAIIETSGGLDRSFLVFLADAYTEEKVKGEKRIVLKIHPKLAAYKAAVFPLVRKDGLDKKAKKIFDTLNKNFNVYYDERGSIGRRYRRQDEIGTPYCITIDYDTKKDNKVTIRDRDSMKQKRVEVDALLEYISKKL